MTKRDDVGMVFEMTVGKFQKIIWDFYKKNKRIFPWRNSKNSYKILVSEIMLQQTQVSRVLLKYPEFVRKLPDFKSLNNSSISEILKIWQGMGYNRRALYLKKIADIVQKEHKGKLPKDPKVLETFPGIGKATACSIVVFSFNTPLVFVETNVRRVFIHHFFKEKTDVHDKDIFPFVEETLDRTNPREWYYALMDYGSFLAKNEVNPNRRSAHYKKQTKFNGSLRQVRGQILKTLLNDGNLKKVQLKEKIQADDRFEKAFKQLLQEGFISLEKNKAKIV